MAISRKATGSWALLTADGAVSIPGSPAAGDRMFLWASWKDFSITAQVSGWTEVTEFADGAVSAAANVGSVKVGCWYRDWQSGDGNPTLDFSSSPTTAGAVIEVWQKGATDVWDTPTFVTAAIAAATTWSATSSSTLTVKDGAVVFELAGFRDDSATMTRSATTALEDDGSPNVTWNGNVVESPATHFSDTTGQDLSADLIHRLVTTGAAGVNLTATGTLSASETGAVLWVHQGFSAAEEHSGTATLTGGGVAVLAGQKTGSSSPVLTGGGVAVLAGTPARTAAPTLTGGGVAVIAWQTARTGASFLTGGGVVALSPSSERSSTVAGTGGGSAVPVGRKDAAIAPVLTGGGAGVLVGAKGANSSPALTGGGVAVLEAAAGHTGAAVLAGGGVALLIGAKGAIASPVLTGGGAGVLSQSTQRASSPVLTGGGIVVIEYLVESGGEEHSGTAVLTGGGAAVLAGAKGGAVAVVLTGGGVVVLEASPARAYAAALSGGGIATLAQATDRAGSASLTGGGRLVIVIASLPPFDAHLAAAVDIAAVAARGRMAAGSRPTATIGAVVGHGRAGGADPIGRLG